MPVLNEALGARLNTTPVRRIYRGTEIICPGVENLATNPSFETTSGTVEVYRNRATNPSFEAESAAVEVYRNLALSPRPESGRWSAGFGTGGAGSSGVYDHDPRFWSGTSCWMNLATLPSDTNNMFVSPTHGAAIGLNAGWSYWVSMQWGWDWQGPAQPYLYSSLAGTWSDHLVESFGDGTNVTSARFVPSVTGSAWMALAFNAPPTNPGANVGVGSFSIYARGVRPSFRYSDGYVSPDADFTPAWTGAVNASESVLIVKQMEGVFNPNLENIAVAQSIHWSKSGAKSLRIMPKSTSSDTCVSPGGDVGAMRLGMVAGQTYTAMATLRLAAPQVGATAYFARSITLLYRIGAGSYEAIRSTPAPNVAGEHEVRLTFTVPVGSTEAFIRLYNGASEGNGDVWWDDFLLVEGAYDGPYFDGSYSPDPDLAPSWVGAANNSASVLSGSGLPGAGVDTFRKAFSSQQWAGSGSGSVRVLSLDGSNGWGIIAADCPNEDGQLYTVLVKCRTLTAMNVRLSLDRNGMNGVTLYDGSVNGEAILRGTYTGSSAGTHARLAQSGFEPSGIGDSTWWDDIMIVEGTYDGPYRDGDSPGWVWTGTPHDSASFGLN